jgi:cobalt/nickel transport system permease protein
VAILTVFMLTTGFNSFLRLLSSLGVPALLIQLFVLTYRYLFVSIREIQRVLIAKEARTYFTRHTLNIESLKHSGALLANIFIRTYERSERVYLAMKSRGFDVNNTAPSKVQSFHKTDLLFVASSIAIFGIFALI